jgi:hypothetical protein
MHRRIVRLELAADAELVDEYEWYSFTAID